jgi:hypothetical protein
MNDITDRDVASYIHASICLEHKPARVIRPHVRPNRTVHRQFERGMRPIGQFNHEGDMEPLAKSILRRMRKNRHNTGAGSYLLGDEVGQVYVVAEGGSTGMGFVNRHEPWHVGRYCAGLRGMLPALEQLIGDLQEHFKGLMGEVAA